MFENLGKKVKNYSDNLRQGVQGVLESEALNNQIKELSRDCDKLYIKIGNAFYDQYQDNVPQAFAEDFQAIREKRAQIDSLKESLRRAKGIWICENCGAENPSDAIFCIKCGTKKKVVQESNQNSSVAGYCPQCGAPYSKDDVYCGNCGYRLPAPAPAEQPVSDSQTVQNPQPDQQTQQ